MIPGTDLARWLSDREAQRRSFERLEAAAEMWSDQPLVTRLRREVADLSPRTSEGLIGAARRFMERTAELDAMMAELIDGCRADPFFRPPFHPLVDEVYNGLLLYHHPDLSISLGVTGVDKLAAKKTGRKGPASIKFTGYATLLRFLKAGDATLSLWEAPEIGDNFAAAEAGRCRLVECRRIEDGEEFVIDGRRQSFVIEHAKGDMLFLQAVVRVDCAPVSVEYDSDSLEFVGASSTDEASSRLQMMVSLLRALGRADAFPLFEEALKSPQFYTRWHVMREMLAMDADAALPSLRRMAEADPHPDIRDAAGQTLAMFFADENEAPGPGGVACPA
jgi:HEAT repeats